jgi:hypothetical protein
VLCTARARSPEVADVSPLLPRASRRLRCIPAVLTTLGEFTVVLASPRCFPRRKSCPGARDRLAPARSPSSAAVSGESAAGLPLTGVPGRPILILRPRSSRAAGSTEGIPVNRSVRRSFAQKPFLFLKFAGRSSHHRETLANRSFFLRFRP